MAEFRETLAKRRSIYEIGTNTDVTLDDVSEALRAIVATLPSSGNSQTTRWVLLSGERNDAVWDMLHEDQKVALSEKMYEMFKPRFSQAKNGLGTILLYESRDAVESMGMSAARKQLYKENNHAISALGTWLLLTDMGLGTSLQHYNVGYEQGFDQKVREYLGLPDDWEMLAQMPFGSIEEQPVDKPKIAPEERVVTVV